MITSINLVLYLANKPFSYYFKLNVKNGKWFKQADTGQQAYTREKGQVPCSHAFFRDDKLKVGIEIEKEGDYDVLVCNIKYTCFV